jgi:hypothetical protein
VLVPQRGGVGLLEERAHQRRHHGLGGLGDPREQVAHGVGSQRCQEAPSRTAALRPSWASEITSCRPLSPRATRPNESVVKQARVAPRVSRSRAHLVSTPNRRTFVYTQAEAETGD